MAGVLKNGTALLLLLRVALVLDMQKEEDAESCWEFFTFSSLLLSIFHSRACNAYRLAVLD